MQIWVGLGNPGAKYALHRHNVGMMSVDLLSEVHRFGPWTKKFRSQISEGRIGRHKVLLVNDHYTPREFVVRVLRAEFRMDEGQSYRVMLTAHQRGVCVVAVFTQEIAERVDTQEAMGVPHEP